VPYQQSQNARYNIVTIKQAKPKHHCQREGLSLVELMIAMTLLALISVAGLKIMQLSESSFSQGRTQLNIQQKKSGYYSLYQ
jgi:prepilin-type N-terminal cleavage/methylation domain-containing protein